MKFAEGEGKGGRKRCKKNRGREGKGRRNGVGRKRGEKKRRGGREKKEENASYIFCMSCLPNSQPIGPWIFILSVLDTRLCHQVKSVLLLAFNFINHECPNKRREPWMSPGLGVFCNRDPQRVLIWDCTFLLYHKVRLLYLALVFLVFDGKLKWEAVRGTEFW